MSFDVEAVRKDFPILQREIHGVPLVYLDSANSAQKPQVVIDAESDLYANHYANVARAVHTLGSEVTHAYEGARDKVAEFLNAPSNMKPQRSQSVTHLPTHGPTATSILTVSCAGKDFTTQPCRLNVRPSLVVRVSRPLKKSFATAFAPSIRHTSSVV